MVVMFACCGSPPKRTVFRKRGDRPTISKDRCNYPDVTLYYTKSYVKGTPAAFGHSSRTGDSPGIDIVENTRLRCIVYLFLHRKF